MQQLCVGQDFHSLTYATPLYDNVETNFATFRWTDSVIVHVTAL